MIKATISQVKQHNDKSCLWIVINNKIYDHPGGEEVLLEHAGTNATKAFDEVGHSIGARELLKEYCIGEVVEDESKSNVDSKSVKNAVNKQLIIVAATVAAAAVVFYYFFAHHHH